MYRLQWPCCILSLLHVEPLHTCDLPAATFKLSSLLVSFAFNFLWLPLSAPQIKSSTCHHKCVQASPLCSVYSLPVYIYRRSPSQQWPASGTPPCSLAVGPTWSLTRRVWGDARTSAPESLALLHARHRCLWRHGCLLSGLGSRAAAISLPDWTTSSRTRSSSQSSRRRWRPGTFGMIFYRVNPIRLLATCQVPHTGWSSTASLGSSATKKAGSLIASYLQNNLNCPGLGRAGTAPSRWYLRGNGAREESARQRCSLSPSVPSVYTSCNTPTRRCPGTCSMRETLA